MRYAVELEHADPIIAASLRKADERKVGYAHASSPAQAGRFVLRRHPGYGVRQIFPAPVEPKAA